ncbi:transmembrane secretion effector [Halopolyspora algeriensis]|uniref:Transmembrane secretion effector n=1 Tax=Halopolyspora algeriensis TaxID=1500506 RepID=A0A368VY36_9ACTN|nr:transmembrane secretion effector [Halopolyspora algeriensis]
MVAADLLRCAAQVASGVLLVTGTAGIGMLVVLQATAGVGTAVFTPAATGLVPSLVPAGVLRQANALLGLTTNVNKVVSISAAGVLVATLGSGWALLVDAATFAADERLRQLSAGGLLPPSGGEVSERDGAFRCAEGEHHLGHFGMPLLNSPPDGFQRADQRQRDAGVLRGQTAHLPRNWMAESLTRTCQRQRGSVEPVGRCRTRGPRHRPAVVIAAAQVARLRRRPRAIWHTVEGWMPYSRAITPPPCPGGSGSSAGTWPDRPVRAGLQAGCWW